jgi:Flp pilus assembly protein TadD
VYDEWGHVALVSNDPRAALQLAGRALAVDPFYRPADKTAAEALIVLGDDSAAANAYAAYFADDRNAADVVALRAQLGVLLRLKRNSDALAVAETVAVLTPNNAAAQADLAVARVAAGDRAGARVAAERAQQLAPLDEGIADLVRELMPSADSD